jgi:hypothetical protein
MLILDTFESLDYCCIFSESVRYPPIEMYRTLELVGVSLLVRLNNASGSTNGVGVSVIETGAIDPRFNDRACRFGKGSLVAPTTHLDDLPSRVIFGLGSTEKFKFAEL